MRKASLVLFVLLLAVESYAACSGTSPNLTAANASRDEVLACFNVAYSGDTINVPAGAATWSSGITIGSKNITIKGAGIGNTVITLSGGNYTFTMGNNTARIFDMTLVAGGMFIDGKDFVVGRIRFDNTSNTKQFRLVNIQGMNGYHPYGVIHSCIFDNVSTEFPAVYDIVYNQGVTWALPYGLGDPRNTVFIEGCTFTKTANVNMNCIDGRLSARTVMRFNTIVAEEGMPGFHIEAHSVQDQTAKRGYMRWEYYNNIQNNKGPWFYYPFRIRAGTGVVFNNDIIGNWSNFGMALDNVRSFEDYSGSDAGNCDGNSPWDGNEDATGYPCRDQIGRGPDAIPWVNSPPAAYTQPLMPAYAWNNKNQNNVECPFNVINNSAKHIQANRDYYNYAPSFNGTSGVGRGLLAARPATCTKNVGYFATDVGPMGALYQCGEGNTWTNYFEPYTCPHPLADPNGEYHCDMTVAGVAGYGMQGAPDPGEPDPDPEEPEPTGLILPWVITGG